MEMWKRRRDRDVEEVARDGDVEKEKEMDMYKKRIGGMRIRGSREGDQE